jgi:hypothetical protein
MSRLDKRSWHMYSSDTLKNFLWTRKHSQAALWSLLVPRRFGNQKMSFRSMQRFTNPLTSHREVIPPQTQEESKL